MAYSKDSDVIDGYYELHLGFFWNDNRDEGPQNVTVDFKLTEEMEEDYLEIEEQYDRIDKADKEKERWVADHMNLLLEMGLVTEAYGHQEIESVQDLESQISNIGFKAFYY